VIRLIVPTLEKSKFSSFWMKYLTLSFKTRVHPQEAPLIRKVFQIPQANVRLILDSYSYYLRVVPENKQLLSSQVQKNNSLISGLEQVFSDLNLASSAKHNLKELDIELIEKISESSCSRLYKVHEKQQDKILFLKEFELVDNEDYQEASTELSILLSLIRQDGNCEFVDLLSARSKPIPEDPKVSLKRFCLLLEAGEGSLKDLALYKQANGREWTEAEIHKILVEALTQLQQLHKNNVVCRDIRPEHLVFSQGKVKVVDFSQAMNVQDSREKLGVVGALQYMAPELAKAHQKVLKRTHYDPVKTDTYSLAQVILGLPFPNIQNKETLTKDFQDKYPGVYKVLEPMLHEDPNTRVSFLELNETSAEGEGFEDGAKIKEFMLSQERAPVSLAESVEQAVIYGQLGNSKQVTEVTKQILPKSENFEKLVVLDRIRIFDLLAEAAISEGNIPEGIENYRRGLKLKKPLVGDAHECIIATYTTVSKLLLKIREYSKAIEYYELLVGIKKVKDENNPELATVYFELGILYEQINNLQRAKESYESALKINRLEYGENSPKLINIYSTLGNLEERMGHYNEAVELLQTALKVKLKNGQEDQASLASIYNNLGHAYERFLKPKYALENYQKALNIWLKTKGERSENVGTAYNNIGSAYDSLGDRKQAVNFYEKALAIRIEIFGAEHSSIAQIYNNLATSYFHLQKFDKALENYNKCLSQWIKFYGEEHIKVATVYNNIANVYTSLKKKAEAQEYFEKSVEIKGKVLGKSHPSLATTYATLGLIYWENNNKDKALEVLELAHEIRNEQLGKTNPATQEVYTLLIKLKKAAGKL